MILIAGGSGQLGRDVVGRLARRGLPIRVLTRDPERAGAALARAGMTGDHIEFVMGDVRDPASVERAVRGTTVVVSAIQGFGGIDAGGIGPVDREGNLTLVRAASSAGVGRFVLLSIFGASATDTLALGRAKWAVEEALRASGVAWTIVRPTAYMETWASVVGEPILASGRARVFGHGRNPINFVSAQDVGALVELAAVDDRLTNRSIDIGGPDNVTFEELAGMFAHALDRPVPVSHVPRPMMRVLSNLLRPVRPILADQIAAGVILDTVPRAVDGGATRADFPDLPMTSFETVVGARVAAASHETRTASA